MAGIGFVLRKLARRDDLAGVFQGYFYSAIVSSGPWLFTILTLGLLSVIGHQFLYREELATFRIIIIYNFGFSLVLSAPFFMIATRHLADLIYAREAEKAPGMFLGALTTLFAIHAPLVLWFYLIYADIPPLLRVGAIANYFLITGIWLSSVFITALKEFSFVTRSFAVGMIVSLLSAAALASVFSISGMLYGFNLGLAIIFFGLSSRVFAEYPETPREPFAFLRHMGRYWKIAMSGFLYNLAGWVDKWIMWFAPERERLPAGFISYPDYDTGMFLAYLTIVPAMALFTFHVETRFFEHYLRFYQDIQSHVRYERIERNHRELWNAIMDSARGLLVLQVTICTLAILLAPAILEELKVSPMQLGIFRLGVLGAMFHVLTLFLIVSLYYFDVRRQVLFVTATFLAGNAGLTWLSLRMGTAWYGWGYAVAAILGFAVAYVLVANHVRNLPYQTFIRRNTSIYQ
jgi:uncharacterized membrane protein